MRPIPRSFCLTLALAALPAAMKTTAHPVAQSTGDVREPEFEAVSVKLNNAGAGPRLIRPLAGGRLDAINAPLTDLVLFAYALQGLDFRATGMPSWASSSNYDVTARMDPAHVASDGTFSIDDMRAMTRSLLRTRFKLVAHMENREQPVYALVKARADGRLGPHLQPSGEVCPPVILPAGLPAPPAPPPPPGTSPDAAAAANWNCVGLSMGGHMSVRKTTMTRFADMLSLFVRRVVIDRTGLEGMFDADVDYSPDPAITQQGVGGRPGAPPPGTNANMPELFTALRDQLGLKLESSRGPVNILVVENLQRPTEN